MAFSITSAALRTGLNANNTLLDALSNFSISYWIKSSSTQTSVSLSEKENGGLSAGFYIQLNPSTGAIGVGKNNGAFQANSTASIYDGAWHSLIVCWDAAVGITGYVDGLAISFSGGIPGTPATNTSAFSLGNTNLGASSLIGQFFDIRVYNITLTLPQASLIAHGGGIGSANLQAEWPFNNNSGTAMQDSTGNGNTLTFNTSPAPFSSTDIPPQFLAGVKSTTMFLTF